MTVSCTTYYFTSYEVNEDFVTLSKQGGQKTIPLKKISHVAVRKNVVIIHSTCGTFYLRASSFRRAVDHARRLSRAISASRQTILG